MFAYASENDKNSSSTKINEYNINFFEGFLLCTPYRQW